MRSKLIATAAMIFCMPWSQASAASNSSERFPYWYIGLTGGLVNQRDSDWGNSKIDYDTGTSFGGSLGYRPRSFEGSRIEIEGLYITNDMNNINGGTTVTGSVHSTSTMLNFYYDFGKPTASFRPYIGFGGGYSRVVLKDNTGSIGKYTPAYQARLGVSYAPETFNNVVDLTFGYRLFGTKSVSLRDQDLDILDHSAEIGARFNF